MLVGHTFPGVPGSWLGPGLYSSGGRDQGGRKILFQGFSWVVGGFCRVAPAHTLSLLFCLFSGSQFISNPKSGTTPLLSSISRFIYTALFLVIILGCTILTGSAFKVLLSPGISPVKFLSRSQAILTRTEAEQKL